MAGKRNRPILAPPTPGDPTRTCPPRGCSTKEKIEWIVDMMSQWQWDGNRSISQLSEHWGISPARVRHYSGEANRFLQFDPVDLEYKRRRHERIAEELRLAAMRNVNVLTGQADIASALKALEQSACYGGIATDTPAVNVNTGQVVINVTREVQAGLGILNESPKLLDAGGDEETEQTH